MRNLAEREAERTSALKRFEEACSGFLSLDQYQAGGARWALGKGMLPVFQRLRTAMCALRDWKQVSNQRIYDDEDLKLGVRVVADQLALDIAAAAGPDQDGATIAWVLAGLRCPATPSAPGAAGASRSLRRPGRMGRGLPVRNDLAGLAGNVAGRPRDAYHLAARYGRHGELRAYRAHLVNAIPGAVVVSRWIDGHGRALSERFTPTTLRDEREVCAECARLDFEDVLLADTVVLFTGRGDAGGRHVDYGVGWAHGKRLAVIGEPEHVAHCPAEVAWHPTFAGFLVAEASLREVRDA